MISKKIFFFLIFILIIILINSCTDDFTASPGTYSGTFTYGVGFRAISGEIRFTVERSSFEVITDLDVSISGCKDLYKYLSAVIPDDKDESGFAIFDIPVENCESGLSIHCIWNDPDKPDEAKCGIAMYIDDTCGQYGGSAHDYGFTIRKN